MEQSLFEILGDVLPGIKEDAVLDIFEYIDVRHEHDWRRVDAETWFCLVCGDEPYNKSDHLLV